MLNPFEASALASAAGTLPCQPGRRREDPRRPIAAPDAEESPVGEGFDEVVAAVVARVQAIHRAHGGDPEGDAERPPASPRTAARPGGPIGASDADPLVFDVVPPHLGRIRVALSRRSGRVEVSLLALRAEAHQVLLGGLDELRARLARAAPPLPLELCLGRSGGGEPSGPRPPDGKTDGGKAGGGPVTAWA